MLGGEHGTDGKMDRKIGGDAVVFIAFGEELGDLFLHMRAILDRHQNGELISSPTADDGGGGERPAQDVGKAEDHLVARIVSERVVDVLEPVHVDHHDGIRLGGGNVFVHQLRPAGAVDQPRAAVRVRLSRGILNAQERQSFCFVKRF